jgi:hypothetical protein
MKWQWCLCIQLFFCFSIMAEPNVNEPRAKFNYQMLCQGCHTAEGFGNTGVPQLKGFVGYFLNSQLGREYLIRIPGSANATLDDEQLAEVINWTIIKFGEASIPKNWRYYNAEEVAKYRQNPLMEVLEYRKHLILQIQKNLIVENKRAL